MERAELALFVPYGRLYGPVGRRGVAATGLPWGEHLQYLWYGGGGGGGLAGNGIITASGGLVRGILNGYIRNMPSFAAGVYIAVISAAAYVRPTVGKYTWPPIIRSLI